MSAPMIFGDNNNPRWLKVIDITVPPMPFLLEGVTVPALDSTVVLINMEEDEVEDQVQQLVDLWYEGTPFILLFGSPADDPAKFEFTLYRRIDEEDQALLDDAPAEVEKINGLPGVFREVASTLAGKLGIPDEGIEGFLQSTRLEDTNGDTPAIDESIGDIVDRIRRMADNDDIPL